jgi:hypothetical protein
VPDEAPQQYCSQETYIQIRIKKINENGDNKNETEWTGCSILSSTTSENGKISLHKAIISKTHSRADTHNKNVQQGRPQASQRHHRQVERVRVRVYHAQSSEEISASKSAKDRPRAMSRRRRVREVI